MSNPTHRTKLSPVYLTASERSLVRSAMDVLITEMHDASNAGAIAAFSRAHTIDSIEEIAALFHYKASPPNEGKS